MKPDAEVCSTKEIVEPAGILASASWPTGPVVAVSVPLQKPSVTSWGGSSCEGAVVVTTSVEQNVAGSLVIHWVWYVMAPLRTDWSTMSAPDSSAAWTSANGPKAPMSAPPVPMATTSAV